MGIGIGNQYNIPHKNQEKKTVPLKKKTTPHHKSINQTSEMNKANQKKESLLRSHKDVDTIENNLFGEFKEPLLKCMPHKDVEVAFSSGAHSGGKTGSLRTSMGGGLYQTKPPSNNTGILSKSNYRFGSNKFSGDFNFIETTSSTLAGRMQETCGMSEPLESAQSRDGEGVLWYHSKYKSSGHADIDQRFSPFLTQSTINTEDVPEETRKILVSECILKEISPSLYEVNVNKLKKSNHKNDSILKKKKGPDKNPFGNHHVTFVSQNSHSLTKLKDVIGEYKPHRSDIKKAKSKVLKSLDYHIKLDSKGCSVKDELNRLTVLKEKTEAKLATYQQPNLKNNRPGMTKALNEVLQNITSKIELLNSLGEALIDVGIYHVDYEPQKNLDIAGICDCLALSALLGNDDPNAANIMVNADGKPTLIDVNGFNMQRRSFGSYNAQNNQNGPMDFINNSTVSNPTLTGLSKSKLHRDYPGLFYSSKMADAMKKVADKIKTAGPSNLVAPLKESWTQEIDSIAKDAKTELNNKASIRLEQIAKEMSLLATVCIDSEPNIDSQEEFKARLETVELSLAALKEDFSNADKVDAAKKGIEALYDQVGHYFMNRADKMSYTSKLMNLQTEIDADLERSLKNQSNFNAQVYETSYQELLNTASDNGSKNKGGGLIWMRPNSKISAGSITPRPRGTLSDYIKQRRVSLRAY